MTTDEVDDIKKNASYRKKLMFRSMSRMMYGDGSRYHIDEGYHSVDKVLEHNPHSE